MRNLLPPFGIHTLVVALILGTAPVAGAQSPSSPSSSGPGAASSTSQKSTDLCPAEINFRLGWQQRFFRKVLFGEKEFKDQPVGSVKIDYERHTWMKTANNTWRSVDPGQESVVRRDADMDEIAFYQNRMNGILEVRYAQTSELIPPMLQALRALQCEMRATCMIIEESRKAENKDKETVEVQPAGCMKIRVAIVDVCKESDIASLNTGWCDTTVDQIIERESRVLELIVAYDASYRSLLQFSGIFEGFLDDFRFPLLQPLWQMVRAIGALDDLPCFISQCDE